MSDLERLDPEAITESPTLLPQREGTKTATTRTAPVAPPAADPEPGAADTGLAAPSPEPGAEPDDAAPTASDSAAASTTGGPPKKRRRRGSRGGRRRKKPGSAAGGGQGPNGQPGRAGASGTPTTDEPALDEPALDDDEDDEGEDWSDPEADRGLTDDDIAEKAREEAGLPVHHRPRPKPQIGDSRPAPNRGATAPAETAPKKRRRRRGGRGRGGGGGNGGNGPNAAAATATAQYVDAGALALGDVDVDGTALLESLDEETLERRRGTHRKGRPAGRYLMVVHQRADGVAHIAVLEGRTLVEHYVSTPTDDNTSIDGNIYLGRVQNVLPGMEAAFIDIGTPKNGVLYRGDVVHDTGDVEGGERPRIERVLRNGQSIIVQVTKNPIGHKGARLTQEVSLAGRFVVMVPGQPQTYGISKRLPDDERRRLRRVLDRLRPADAGLIVRTAAEGATEEELERDMLRLNAQWQQISDLSKRVKPGNLLYKEPPLAIRLIREEFTKEYRGVVIDDAALHEEVRGYVEAIAPELADRIEYYDAADEHLPVFEKFHVHEQLHKALDRKVWLPSGGSIIVERTEALTVIDVNTGKNVGASNLEETVYRNNLEAAEVVARELRLRDIGGIIVIDFIDMETRDNREAVEEAFRHALARDKTRTQVFPISELGLLEMTRKRVSEGLVEAFSSTCPHCNGRGFVIDDSLLE
jgi:ribonuclease E